MANVDHTSQRGIGWLFGLVIVILILAGLWWWMRAAPAEAPPPESPEVGMVGTPMPLPRT